MNHTFFETLRIFESLYQELKPAQENSDEAFAWFSGIPHPLFNAIMHFKPERNMHAKLDAILAIAPAKTPLSFWMSKFNSSSDLKKSLGSKGFQSMLNCALMEW